MIEIDDDAFVDSELSEQEAIHQQVKEATEDGVGGIDVVEKDGRTQVVRWNGDPPTYDPLQTDAKFVERYVCNAEEVDMAEIGDR